MDPAGNSGSRESVPSGFTVVTSSGSFWFSLRASFFEASCAASRSFSRSAIWPSRFYRWRSHILPSGKGAAQKPVPLLHLIPLMHFKFSAGHSVACSRGKPLSFQKRFFVQLPVMNKGHHIDSSQVAHSMTVQKDLSAGIAAPEICSSLLSGFFVYPSGLPE